jgi:hypothetical protein
MTALRNALIALILAFGLQGAARAEDPPEPAAVDPVTQNIPAPGTTLSPAARAKLRALVDSDEQLRKQVMSAAQSEIKDKYEREQEDKAAATFAEQKSFVIAAYGIMWGLLLVFLGMMWRRQRGLERELASMAAKVAKVKAEAAS